MDKEMLTALKALLDERDERLSQMMDAKLEPIKKDIQTIKHDVKEVGWKVDILYDWVDGLDLEVKDLKKQA